jgi:hypothetical protein
MNKTTTLSLTLAAALLGTASASHAVLLGGGGSIGGGGTLNGGLGLQRPPIGERVQQLRSQTAERAEHAKTMVKDEAARKPSVAAQGSAGGQAGVQREGRAVNAQAGGNADASVSAQRE